VSHTNKTHKYVNRKFTKYIRYKKDGRHYLKCAVCDYLVYTLDGLSYALRENYNTAIIETLNSENPLMKLLRKEAAHDK
jgi:hypothetical protein